MASFEERVRAAATAMAPLGRESVDYWTAKADKALRAADAAQVDQPPPLRPLPPLDPHDHACPINPSASVCPTCAGGSQDRVAELVTAFDAERSERRAVERQRDEARAEVAKLRAELADVLAERDAMQALATQSGRELAEAVELLQRAVKYATEDRAVTPGSTRLARLLDKASAFLARHGGAT